MMTKSDLWVELDRELMHKWKMLGAYNRPGRDARRVMTSLLLHGPRIGAQLARDCQVHQGNLVSWTLPMLDRLGIVNFRDLGVLPARGLQPNGKRHNGGGRPAQEWYLTKRGRPVAHLTMHLFLYEILQRYQ